MIDDAAEEARATVEAVSPLRLAPRPRHADPRARRLRPRRGGAARRASPRPSSSGRATAFPDNPRAWLVSAGRFKAIDAHATPRAIRCVARRRSLRGSNRLAPILPTSTTSAVEDDRLRLIFTCCHPALPADAQVAHDAARGLRAHHRGDRARVPQHAAHAWRSGSCAPRRKIRDAQHSLPGAGAGRAARSVSTAVLHVVYLVFNEGYSAIVRARR